MYSHKWTAAFVLAVLFALSSTAANAQTRIGKASSVKPQAEGSIAGTLSADPAAMYPRLIAGALRCPPEDCGGIPGFYAFLDAVSDPKHPDHDDRMDWYGDTFDPDSFDAARINKDLGRIALRRKRAAAKRPR